MKNHDNSSSKPVFSYLTEQDAQTLHYMRETLYANGIPAEYYHVGGYSEEAVCMEKTDAGWAVYVGERGNPYQLTTYKTVYPACICLLNQVAESDEQFRKMVDEFKEKCLTREWELGIVAYRGMVMAGEFRAAERALAETIALTTLKKAVKKAVKAKDIIERAKLNGKSKTAKPIKPR